MKYYNLPFLLEKKLTQNSKWIEWNIPTEFQNEFLHKAGQFIRIKIWINGVEYLRDYSICSLPNSKNLAIVVKKTHNGLVSTYLVDNNINNLSLEISTPQGKFLLKTKPNEKRTIVAFTHGSGITAIYSHILHILSKEKEVQFFLFYGNSIESEVIFKEELQKLGQKYSQNFYPYFVFSQEKVDNPLFEGRIDKKKLELYINQILEWDEVDVILLSGSKDMVIEMYMASIENGIPSSQIYYEIYDSLEFEMHKNKESRIIPIEVNLFNQNYSIEWETQKKSLLDAMLDNNIEVPYSCKGGVCGTCVCTIEKGSAQMNEQIVLLDDEIEAGKFLPCVSFDSDSSEIKLVFE